MIIAFKSSRNRHISLLCMLYILFLGVISCNGQDGTIHTGGASGGSIKLITGALNGKGRLETNGGKGKNIYL